MILLKTLTGVAVLSVFLACFLGLSWFAQWAYVAIRKGVEQANIYATHNPQEAIAEGGVTLVLTLIAAIVFTALLFCLYQLGDILFQLI